MTKLSMQGQKDGKPNNTPMESGTARKAAMLYYVTEVMAMGRFKKQDMLTFLKAANGASTMPIFSNTG